MDFGHINLYIFNFVFGLWKYAYCVVRCRLTQEEESLLWLTGVESHFLLYCERTEQNSRRRLTKLPPPKINLYSHNRTDSARERQLSLSPAQTGSARVNRADYIPGRRAGSGGSVVGSLQASSSAASRVEFRLCHFEATSRFWLLGSSMEKKGLDEHEDFSAA